jgi:2-keto-4-pentenoate hydratase/2-oxohepta-3-ene-1,7-dioic acid hydratase in catechol pathway
MRIVRYQIGNQEPRFGWEAEGRVGPLSASPLGLYRRLELEHDLEKVRLLPPILPGKIIAVGRNYPLHAQERSVEIPEIPIIFLKPLSSVIGPGDAIQLPPQSQHVEHEVELAVVIGRSGRWIRAQQALQHVLGYTIANDVTARDLQRKDGQWSRAKSFDTFAPVGPYIETDIDPNDLKIELRLNGEVMQSSNTSNMHFKPDFLVSFISHVMTLCPGDIILTGTPPGVGPMQIGDEVEVEIEGIGTLKNKVITL